MTKTPGSPKPRILIVDDIPENLQILIEILGDTYALIPTRSGEKALLLANRTPAPDLILLDVMMPGMDGFEVCRRLKESPATAEIPVIFITAMNDAQSEAFALGVGGVDFITKPIQPVVVQARVKTHLALSHTHRELAERNAQLHWERKLIEDILLTMRAPLAREPRVRTLLTPVERTAGDLFLMGRRPDGHLHALVGDCTGHGLPAAIVGPMVMDIFLAMTRKGLLPEVILTELNSKLYHRLPRHLFMAASFVELTPTWDGLRIWNHGMPVGLLWRQGVWETQWPSASLPLGIVASIPEYDSPQPVALREGDRIFVFSDGVVETCSPNSELFGLPRWMETLDRIIRTGESLTVSHTVLNTFRGSDLLDDDITVVEFRTVAECA
ncbi:MAG: SpoIIE family protein phosphatase [Magnetococcus sp. YQC-9]